MFAFFSQNHFSLHKGAGMAGKMLVERTIFWPGRSGTDAPLRRRSGRGKTGGGSLATGGAGRRRERYSRERGQGRKNACLPRQGREAIAGPWRGWGGLWPCLCPNHLAGDGAGGRRLWGRYGGKRRSCSPDDGRRMTEKGTAPTGLSSNGPLVVPAGEARGPAAGGSDAARVPPQAAPHGPRRR